MDETERVQLLYALLDAIHSGSHQLQDSAREYLQELAELHQILDEDGTCQECRALFAPTVKELARMEAEQSQRWLERRERSPLRLVRRSDEDTDGEPC